MTKTRVEFPLPTKFPSACPIPALYKYIQVHTLNVCAQTHPYAYIYIVRVCVFTLSAYVAMALCTFKKSASQVQTSVLKYYLEESSKAKI